MFLPPTDEASAHFLVSPKDVGNLTLPQAGRCKKKIAPPEQAARATRTGQLKRAEVSDYLSQQVVQQDGEQAQSPPVSHAHWLASQTHFSHVHTSQQAHGDAAFGARKAPNTNGAVTRQLAKIAANKVFLDIGFPLSERSEIANKEQLIPLGESIPPHTECGLTLPGSHAVRVGSRAG